jgi:DNA-directed RNA polymerase subunit RPC12/RpoP
MPIRFLCTRCHQLLGIASRKAGSEIQCPKCGWSQLVPSQEAASAAMAMDQFAKHHEAAEANSSLMVYDDQPAPIETFQLADSQQAGLKSVWNQETCSEQTPGPPTVGRKPAPQTPDQLGGRTFGRCAVPPGMILYPRRTLYLQGLLLLVVFAVGLGSGYLIGRGGAEDKGPEDQATPERILIEGRLVYDAGTGRPAGDQDAVIIALPQGKLPKTKISFYGARPQADSAESQQGARRIRELDGEYVRADASGDFSLVIPDRGRYYLLLISNHATRPEGTDVDEADLIEIGRYFSMPALLIGRYKYCWMLRDIGERQRFDYDFDRDGQEHRRQ